jgi:hypothetical protein
MFPCCTERPEHTEAKQPSVARAIAQVKRHQEQLVTFQVSSELQLTGAQIMFSSRLAVDGFDEIPIPNITGHPEGCFLKSSQA